MRSKTFNVPATRRHNRHWRALFRTLLWAFLSCTKKIGAGRQQHVGDKRASDHDDADLAQRVRECGEW